jgi:hypothetical protein
VRLTVYSQDTLAVGVVNPSDDNWWNWTTNAFETPFNPASHLRPLVPLEAAPSPASTIQTANLDQVPYATAGLLVAVYSLSTTPPSQVPPQNLQYLIQPLLGWGWVS